MSGTTPAGWYQDGVNAGQERYWDGTRWTDQFRPLGAPVPPGAPQAAPAGRPSGFGTSARQVFRGARLLVAGQAETAVDEALGVEQRGGSRLWVWLIPVAVTAILVGFFSIAFAAAPVGIAKESLGGFGAAIPFSPHGGALTGAFFLGIAAAAVFFALRALALVLTARASGGRVAFLDALTVVATGYVLFPVGWVLATVFLAIPGSAGLTLALIVEVFLGVPLLLLAELSIHQGLPRATQLPKSPLFLGALFAGLALAIAWAVYLGVEYGVMMAGIQSSAAGMMNGFLGSLQGLGGFPG